MMAKAIETVRLRRTFGEAVAVDDLDLVVEQGTFFGFLGPNGAGKSTTIKMLTGVLGPSGGTAEILGHDVVQDAVEAKRKIGVVPEESALFERLTGPEYLRFVGRMYALPRLLIDARSEELLRLMDLLDDSGKLIIDYSHGMRKKLSLCAAIIHEPQVLFLDEPFEGIDAVSSQLVRSVLNQLVDHGVTVFLTSHILEIVEKLCTHVAIIHRGRLVADDSLDRLRDGAGATSLEELFFSTVGGHRSIDHRLSWLD
jgi:ABC-2 type transport system ATP-binding protein